MKSTVFSFFPTLRFSAPLSLHTGSFGYTGYIEKSVKSEEALGRHAARDIILPKMQNEIPAEKEIVVKKISESKFEVYEEEKKEVEEEGQKAPPPRKSVIQRAPPAQRAEDPPAGKRRKTEGGPTGVILIRDAIMYRIVDILMWKVMGENQLKNFGYPVASTHQVLWRIVHQNFFLSGARKGQEDQLPQDHDCGGNLNCFANHVYQFLEMCAPNLWTRTGWGKLSIEDILRRIYYEDLIPYLRSLDLRNSLNVFQCHSDIVLLEKWERQKFTAVTWSGEKYFSQAAINCPRCPQCSNRHL